MSQTKLMVALRDPEHVNQLVKLACQLTRAMEAELTAIHVVEVGPGLPLDIEAPVLDQPGRMSTESLEYDARCTYTLWNDIYS
jgi:K+-sensing histidine kinase KdpD